MIRTAVTGFLRRNRTLLIMVSAFLLAAPFGGYYAASLLWPLERERIAEAERGGATEILDRRGGLIAWRVDGQDSWRVPVALDQVSPWVVKSIIAAEDQRFWTHCGVDPFALARAASQNVLHGRRVSGASTISMQAMRLLHPAKRDWSAKLSEAFRALQTEGRYGKDAILELYLNLAPYGGNVVGIEAAARHYFGKSAQELTLGEAALLSGIPQSPSRFNPRKHLEAALQRRQYVLERMEQLGMASKEEFEAARMEKFEIHTESANIAAPHFADYVMQRNKSRGGIVRTTIDPAIQAMAETVVAQKYRELSACGIDGLAAVVLDTKDSSLLAMIGNANAGSAAFGDINGATSKRQPGSLLKPFLFCSAYEMGLLTPDSVVYDVPAGWKEYRPENMDRDYMGAISAAEALRNSRNIPAVRVLQQIGLPRFADKLNKMGLKTAGTVEQYSLSLALGTAEMSLLDLANAYAMLAREGRYIPLKTLSEDGGSVEAVPVFTPQSAWLAIQSLPANHDGTLAWKTGTSWNYRDAWAVCISPRYVVGIWCGNFSGNGNNRLVGARSALPVALELADSLKPKHADGWQKPPGVATRRVCALSGCVPGASCPHVKLAPYIPGVSAESVCTLHRMANTADTMQEDICWPADVAAFLSKEREPAADMQIRKTAMKLLSPVADAVYFIPRNQLDKAKKLDLSSVSSDGQDISYFIDGEYVGREESGKALAWTMVPGSHTVIAATTGKCARVDFVVKTLED